MKIPHLATICFAIVGITCLPHVAIGQSVNAATPRVAAIPANPATTTSNGVASPAPRLKFTFLLFFRDNNTNTQQMAETLKAAMAKRPGSFEWSAVNVNDPVNQLLVEQYQVGRAPMPLAVCVASNGAITGAYMRQLNEMVVERSLVTPAMAEVTKALQDKKIVLLHLKPTAESPLPQGGVDFAADPSFQARTTIVNLTTTDAAETRFLSDLKIPAVDVRDSLLVVMAPPAVFVGKFDASATKDQIAAKLHAAGKCCDDPNCKHNKAAQQ